MGNEGKLNMLLVISTCEFDEKKKFGDFIKVKISFPADQKPFKRFTFLSNSPIQQNIAAIIQSSK